MIFLVEIFPDVFNGFLQTGLSRLMRVELGNKTNESSTEASSHCDTSVTFCCRTWLLLDTQEERSNAS